MKCPHFVAEKRKKGSKGCCKISLAALMNVVTKLQNFNVQLVLEGSKFSTKKRFGKVGHCSYKCKETTHDHPVAFGLRGILCKPLKKKSCLLVAVCTQATQDGSVV